MEAYIENYDVASIDYALSESRKFRYLHNLFKEEAKLFLRLKVQRVVIGYGDAQKMITDEYRSVTR